MGDRFRGDLADFQPVGLDLVPLLNLKAMRLDKGAAAYRIGQADDLFQHGNQRAQRVFAEDRAFGDGRDVFVFRNGYSESVAAVDMQHDVNVGTAVAYINDAVGADLQPRLQVVKRSDLSVARRHADDRFALAGLRSIAA